MLYRDWLKDFARRAGEQDWGAFRGLRRNTKPSQWDNYLREQPEWKPDLTKHFRGIFAKVQAQQEGSTFRHHPCVSGHPILRQSDCHQKAIPRCPNGDEVPVAGVIWFHSALQFSFNSMLSTAAARSAEDPCCQKRCLPSSVEFRGLPCGQITETLTSKKQYRNPNLKHRKDRNPNLKQKKTENPGSAFRLGPCRLGAPVPEQRTPGGLALGGILRDNTRDP